jgi:hypothetical protein
MYVDIQNLDESGDFPSPKQILHPAGGDPPAPNSAIASVLAAMTLTMKKTVVPTKNTSNVCEPKSRSAEIENSVP